MKNVSLSQASTKKRIVIVGGVAGGASAATRARRLCEDCEIIMIERGEHVSFANCGLPYHLGGVIEDEEALLVAKPKLFLDRFGIDVRTETEVTSIDPEAKSVTLRDVKTGQESQLGYDELLLSPGAKPIIPPLPGVQLPGVYSLRNIADVRRIREAMDGALKAEGRALVVGGGFIGIELAENLRHRGLEVTLLERGDQLMPSIDKEMAALMTARLEENGVVVQTSQSASEITMENRQGAVPSLLVHTTEGVRHQANLVLFCVGVRPESELAENAGLAVTDKGAIFVDRSLRTSDPHVWAVGDAVEVKRSASESRGAVALAGPANRQGRLVAENMVRGEDQAFQDMHVTSILGAFDLVAASTGENERNLRARGMEYHVVYAHPKHHAGYYPGAKTMAMKLIFSKDGVVLGAQAVGEKGVARRIDVISMVMQYGGTVKDLADAELCYAPQFGSAKDPINQLGMMAENVIEGDLPLLPWVDYLTLAEEAESTGKAPVVVDVRSVGEFEEGSLPGAQNIPIESLRDSVSGLQGQEVAVLCASGQRAYVAVRMLLQLGVKARLLSGGMKTREAFRLAS